MQHLLTQVIHKKLTFFWLLPAIIVLPCLLSGQSMTLSRQYVFKEMSRRYARTFFEDHLGFIWVGGTDLHRFDGYAVTPYPKEDEQGKSFSTGIVNAIIEDHLQQLWVAADKGLFRYDRERDVFIRYFADQHFWKGSVQSVYEDHNHALWIGDQQHLYVMRNPEEKDIELIQGIDVGPPYQRQTGIFAIRESKDGIIYAGSNQGLWEIKPGLPPHQLSPPQLDKTLHEFQIFAIEVDQSQRFWLGTNAGLWKFGPTSGKFESISMPDKSGQIIQSLYFDTQDHLWIGSANSGLYQLKDGQFSRYSHDPNNQNSIMANNILAVFFDRFQNLWLGTDVGISTANFGEQRFPFYQVEPGAHKYNNFVYRLMQDRSGGFWFRFLRMGLGYSKDLEEKCEILLQPESHSNIEEIKNFAQDVDGNVWVITLTNGLFKFLPGSTIPQPIDIGPEIKKSRPLSIISDRKDDRYLWVSTRIGLCRINRVTFQTDWYNPQTNLNEFDPIVALIAQDSLGRIWGKVRSNGILRLAYFDPKDEQFKADLDNPRHATSVEVKPYRNFKVLNDEKVWVIMDRGWMVINPVDFTYTTVGDTEDFPVKNVVSFIRDQNGHLWFTGGGGNSSEICRYDGKDYKCFLGKIDIENFIYQTAFLGQDGRITFGGSNGIYSFYPEEISFEKDTTKPEVVLSDFRVFNERRRLGQAYELIEHISLPYKENVFTFEFTSLHFSHVNRLKYRYRLLGFQDNWVEVTDGERLATFTSLPPGTYTFQVAAETSEGVASGPAESLNIQLTIIPPWYRTWWAYTAYGLLTLFLLFLFRRYDHRHQAAKSEARELKALNDFKSRFYTNITHEFRTPITLIQGTADQILQQPSHQLSRKISLIKRNNRRLLELVNQLLDLSMLESGTLTLKPVQADVIAFLKYLTESFHYLAGSHKIRLQFQSETDALVMDYDPARLQDIVTNLLSNAIKFTPKGGKVTVSVAAVGPLQSRQLEIGVRDTGTGITPAELPYIFDRFYQGGNVANYKNSGTGVGLALTKELVNLMRGEIKVESEPHHYTCFTVLLPITRMAAFQEYIPYPDAPPEYSERSDVPPPNGSAGENGHQPTLLIVEDNRDVIAYLSSILQNQYHIITAADGLEGAVAAIEQVPDLVISDVMMPGQDGFALCDQLKRDVRTSHIPIVLLTARADADARLMGLRLGADVYLDKPFDEAELRVQLAKLIELRIKLQQYYQRGIMDPGQQTSKFPIEDEFIQSIRRLVEEDLTQDLRIPRLAEQLNMNRVQLFRKVKALTNKSPSQLIRQIRLEHAKKLLLDPELNVADVAYKVGFSDPAFFSRSFREAFGVSPSEFREE